MPKIKCGPIYVCTRKLRISFQKHNSLFISMKQKTNLSGNLHFFLLKLIMRKYKKENKLEIIKKNSFDI